MKINLFFVSLNCNIPGANRLNPIKVQTSLHYVSSKTYFASGSVKYGVGDLLSS